jgi:hypothetical protein
MLETIRQPQFTESECFAAALHGYVAADRASGALLRASRGRSRGRRHYALVLPTRPPAERGGLFREVDGERRTLSAWDDDEAVERANALLEASRA